MQSLWAMDPLLASGQDDGRGALVYEVASAIQRRFALIQMVPGDTGNMMRLLLASYLRRIGRQLGDQPTVEDWQRVLNRLKRSRADAERMRKIRQAQYGWQ